jgi:PAS domain S-box-containing protein
MGKKDLNKNIQEKKNTATKSIKSRKTNIVTDKKSLEKAKEVSDDMKFLKLAEASPSAILIYDMKGVYYVNKATSNLTGYPVRDLLKMKFWDIIHPEDRDSIKSRGAKRLSGEKMLNRYQFRIITKKKETKWIEFAADLLNYEGNICAVGIALDITDKKEIELNEAFQTSQRIYFQSVLLKLSTLKNQKLSELFRVITKSVAEAIHAERVSIWQFIETRDVLHCEVLYLLSKNSFESEQDLTVELFPEYINALADNLHITANNAHKNQYTKAFADSYLIPNNIFSMLDIPIRISRKVAGVVCIEHIGQLRTWTAEEQYFVTSVAEIISLYIEADERKKAEDALKKAHDNLNKTFRKLKEREEIIEIEREKLEVTLRSIGDGVITTDYDGRILLLNQTAENLTGWKQSEAFGKHIDEVFVVRNELTNKRIATPIDQVLKTGQIVELANHTTLVAKSGEQRIISDSASPIRDSHGNIFGVILVLRDTTDQKLAAEQLRENEEGYRTLFESANDANFIMQDGLFIECNKKAEEVFGCGKEYIIGKTPFEYSPEYQPNGILSSVFAKEKIALALEGNPQSFEWKHTRFDGTVFDAEVSLNKISAQGKPFLQAIVRDITERKKAEEKLIESENLLRNIIGMANLAMAIVGFDGTIEYINNQAVKTFGYEHKDIPNMDNWWRLAYPEENYRKEVVEQYMGLVYKAIEGGKEIERRDYLVTCKDGSLKTMVIFGVIVNDKVFVMFEDITDRKKAEEALAKSEERYRTLVEISPNPIIVHTAGIIEYANDASAKVLGADTKEVLIGKNALEFVHPDDRKFALERIKLATSNQTEAPLAEERFITFDGSLIYVEVTAVSFDNMGRKSMFTMFKDVTERKLAEQNLHMYKFILENTTEEFYLVNPDGSFSYFNEAAAKSLGYSMAEFKLLGIPGIDLIQNTKEKFRKHFEELKLNNLPAFESIHRAKNGNLVTKLIKSIYIEIGGEEYVCGFGHDISESKKIAVAIKESEEKYRSLIEANETGFVILNEHGIVLDANAEYVKLTGYNSLEEILNRCVLEWTAEYSITSNREAIKNCLDQGFIRNFETDYIHKDGTIIPVEISATVEKSANGLTILSLTRNISQRKQAELALIKSQQLFQTLSEVAPVGVFRTRADGFTTYVNPRWCELSGLSFEKALGDGWLNAVHPEDREKIQNTWKLATIQKSKSFSEYRFLKKDGSIVWVIGNAVPEWNNNEIVGYIGTITDITERIKSENFLKESEEKFRSTFDQSPIGSAIVGLDMHFIRCNNAMCRFLGYTENEMIGKAVADVTYPEDLEIGMDVLKKMKEGNGQSQTFQKRYLRKDGNFIWGEITISVVKDINNKPLYLLPIIQDINERKMAEESLKESEEKFRLLFSSTSQAVTLNEIILDEKGEAVNYRIIEANPAFEDHTGLKSNDFIGKLVLDVLPDTELFWIKEFGEVAISGKPKRLENYVKELNRYFDFTVYSPKKGQFALISTDITQRKREEEVKKLNEARLEALIRLNNMAEKPANDINDFSLEEGVKLTGSKIGYLAFTSEDESIFSIHAYSATAMRECNIKDKTFQFFTDKTALLSEVIKQRKAIICNDYSKETLPKNGYPDGHLAIKNFLSIPIFEGEHIVAIAAVSNKDRNYDDADVMQFSLLMNGMWRLIQRKRSDEALKESEERYRLITNNSKDIIAKFGTDGKISFVSPVCKTLLGFEIYEMLNRSVFEFFHPDDIPYLRVYQGRLLSRQAPNLVKHRLRKADGSFSWFESNNQIILEADGGIKEIVAVIRDITELLNSEKLIQEKEVAENASKAKSEFLANMSHEIRNPLNSIIGLSNTLSRSEINAEHREIVESIKISSNNLLNILNDILDFSKIEANKVEISNNVFDVEIVIKDVYSAYKTMAENKKLSLLYQLNKDVPPLLFGDSGKLKQMVINLVGNALKFTESGSININVSQTKTEGDLVLLKIEVSDTGIGIMKEDYDRMFQSFTQLDSSTTKSFAGTGLGLAIVKRYAQLMKGSVNFISEYGKGSTFIIEIPFGIPKEHQIEVKQIIKAMDFSKHHIRLLLAEDDGINQLYLKGLLTGHGILVDTAYNGLQALEKFDANSYDIILMDGQMPKMDGFEATRSIRIREQTKNTHTPIIAITGYAVSGDKEKFLASGMDDYVSKPIDENKLIELIEKYTITEQKG